MITILVLSAISFVALMVYSTIGVAVCNTLDTRAEGAEDKHIWYALFWPLFLSVLGAKKCVTQVAMGAFNLGLKLAAKIRRETKKTMPDLEFIAQVERELGLSDA